MSETLRHLDDEQLLLALYGAPGEPAAAHLDSCPECAARLRRLEARRADLLAAATPPDAARLRAQREAVWRQIERRRRRPLWRALQAGVAVCAVFAAVLLYRPAAPPPETAARITVTDQQLFDDLAAMVSRDAPAAAEPLMALFVLPDEKEMQNQ